MVNFSDGKGPTNLAQRFPLGTWGSLTCSKSTTRVKRLKVPPGGLRSLNFSVLKNSMTSAGFEPASLRSRGGNVTSRPRRPLYFSLLSHFFPQASVCVCLSIYLFISIHPSVHVPIHPSLSLSLPLVLCISVRPSIHLVSLHTVGHT
jgi:hypothetical protein